MRMTYDTYAFLRAGLDKELEAVHKAYVAALEFIPSGNLVGVTAAFDVYSKKRLRILQMQAELHVAAAATYADHPNPEMRKFWQS